MRDIPIIFSAPMVRALLDGRKTQTRRLATSPLAKVKPGDRLWVRENHWLYGRWREDGKTSTGRVKRVFDKIGQTAVFDPPGHDRIAFWGGHEGFTFKPAMHLPRWASRLTLVVEEVRVMPLQAISEEDSIAEGCPAQALDELAGMEARGWFRDLWDSLHGATAWDANPAVVALTFSVIRSNIDALPTASAA